METKMNKELIEAFTQSELSADHYTAYKAGAAQGYLMAKRQMVEAIDHKLSHEHYEYPTSYFIEQELNELRDFIRNVMLWRK